MITCIYLVLVLILVQRQQPSLVSLSVVGYI